MRILPLRLGLWLAMLSVMGCGQDGALSLAPEVRLKPAIPKRLSVVVTLTDTGLPIEGVELKLRPSGSGTPLYGLTDDRGKSTFPLAPVSGYYEAFAEQAGRPLGAWSSLPLNAGREYHLQLDLDGRRSSFAIPHPQEIRTFSLPGGGEIEMVRAGRFRMGSSESEPGRSADEGPRVDVVLMRDFYISHHELTQKQWVLAMGMYPWRTYRDVIERIGNPDGLVFAPEGDAYPAESTCWAGVRDLLDVLNAHTGGEVYRLPIEAEWEYAARAGSQSSWGAGAELAEYAWIQANTGDRGEGYVHPVATRRPNGWGIYDVPGNVAEWVEDWYRPYTGGFQIDPRGPASGIHADAGYRSQRVIRGARFDRRKRGCAPQPELTRKQRALVRVSAFGWFARSGPKWTAIGKGGA
ncbi:MAG: hypothetical protein CME26_14125 [Gemmatimonadetes bacterium]|nr:hypothetical protein [Gemmatimonadota bacterium]